MDRLKALSDVGTLHGEAVKHHQAKRDQLLVQETFQEMRVQLRGAPVFAAAETALRAELGLK